MKYLLIKENKGFFWNGEEEKEIDKINKTDLIFLINAAEKDDFELDPYDEGSLANKAHQVIYENLYTKFIQFQEDKDQFKDQVENMFNEAIRKYSTDNQDENLSRVEEPEQDEVEEETPQETVLS
jgi:hypothetical protein